MKRFSLLLALVIIFLTLTSCSDKETVANVDDTSADFLRINEVMADNKNLIMGNDLDWIEIYNDGEKDVSLDSFYLTDDLADKTALSLKGYSVEAKGYVVITLAEDAPFRLSSKGETVYLLSDGKTVSELKFAETKDGESFDADGICDLPTPGFENTEAGYKQYLATVSLPELIINEIVASNSKYLPVNGQYYDLVEIKNNSDKPIDLSSYSFSDKRKEPERYKFPAVTLQPGEFYVIYCSSAASLGANHAPFKISSANGETVYLAKDGVIIDKVSVPSDLAENESYGRDGKDFLYYSSPTIGSANGSGHKTSVAVPAASVASGIYSSPQSVSLSGNGTIYYTTDGSCPTVNSSVYTAPILVSNVMTIRTFCVDGSRKSNQTAYTYIIGEGHKLPVVFVSIPQESLTGEEKGILNHIEQTYEYECQLTLIENGEQKFSVPCGFRLHGSGSREMAKQNFQLRFRSQYGLSKLKYKLFDNRDFDEFDSLLLKGGSEDFSRAVMRDELATVAIEGATAMYNQAYKPVVLYLGGEYWGIYYLRERFSDDYVASHMNVPEESVDLLYTTGGYVQDGSAADFSSLKSYVNSHDMSLDENYRYLCDRIDVNSLMDWYICRSYMGDRDTANIRRFRSSEGDGKWRWMYFDLDWAFTLSNERPVTTILNDYNGEPILIRGLLRHPEGREAFIKRYAYLMGTILNEQHMNKVLDTIVSQIESEIPRDRARWGRSTAEWENEVARIRNYFKDGKRTEHVKADIKSYFGLTDEQMKSYFG